MSDYSRLYDMNSDLREEIERYGNARVEDASVETLKRIAKKAGQIERFARDLIKESS